MSKITKKQMTLFKKIMDYQHNLILAYHSANREDFEKTIHEMRETLNDAELERLEDMVKRLKEGDNDQK